VKAGATTQDVTDSATVFQIRASFDIIANQLDEAIAATANLARDHRNLPVAGRGNLQQAVPIHLRTTHHRDEYPAVVNDKLFRKWRPCRTLYFDRSSISSRTIARDRSARMDTKPDDRTPGTCPFPALDLSAPPQIQFSRSSMKPNNESDSGCAISRRTALAISAAVAATPLPSPSTASA